MNHFRRAVERQQKLVDDHNTSSLLFPSGFLQALRKAIDSGLTCDEISTLLVLQAGAHEMTRKIDARTMLAEIGGLMSIMERSTRKR